MQWDTVVVGAGVAGLAAARELARAGASVLVLEAQSRAGGRVRTHSEPGLAHAVELGAEFVHGRPPELIGLIAEAGLELEEAGGEPLCFAEGRLGDCAGQPEPWYLLEGMEAYAAAHGDVSFEAYLRSTGAPEGEQTRARSYVEGFNAADAGLIGIVGLARQQAAEEAIEGGRNWRVRGGYAMVPAFLERGAQERGAELRFDCPVARVEWHRDECRVVRRDGRVEQSRCVVVALPLGVLQRGSVEIEGLPEAQRTALRQLRMGAAHRMVLAFRESWWQAASTSLGFLFSPELLPPVWWTVAPDRAPLLTAWLAGPRGAAVGSAEGFTEMALSSLERIFNHDVRRDIRTLLRRQFFHDWSRDPWACGAYSYVPAGAAGAPAVLATPVEQTLFFAGEHTDTTGHPGTVHGALRSGLRAAQQVLAR